MKAQLRSSGVERFSAGRLAVEVYGSRSELGRAAGKAAAALQGRVAAACPASILRTHPAVILFLDRDSASLLHS